MHDNAHDHPLIDGAMLAALKLTRAEAEELARAEIEASGAFSSPAGWLLASPPARKA
jgi:hypothetical protein